MNKDNQKSEKFEAILKTVATILSVGIVLLVLLGTLEIIDILISMRIGVLMLSLVLAINGYNIFPRNKTSAILLYASALLLVVWLASGLAMS